jgi:hypothetical protein
MAMRSIPTMTFHATRFGPNGNARSIAISLPFVGCISDEPHYRAPPPPPPSLPGERRAPAMTGRVIRKVLGKPEPHDAAFEHVLRRIERGGV